MALLNSQSLPPCPKSPRTRSPPLLEIIFTNAKTPTMTNPAPFQPTMTTTTHTISNQHSTLTSDHQQHHHHQQQSQLQSPSQQQFADTNPQQRNVRIHSHHDSIDDHKNSRKILKYRSNKRHILYRQPNTGRNCGKTRVETDDARLSPLKMFAKCLCAALKKNQQLALPRNSDSVSLHRSMLQHRHLKALLSQRSKITCAKNRSRNDS